MRESFGGAFMIKLLLIFIVIYISFMAVAVNYAKTFRVKNQLINILEQTQYDGRPSTIEAIDDYLASVPYNLGTNDAVQAKCKKEENSVFTERGVCIVPKGTSASRYYKVIAYMSIDFPLFNIHMIVPISGETKRIAN